MQQPTPEPAKGTVFRVTGIPLIVTANSLNTVLSSAFSGETQITLDTSQTTICPSCHDKRTQTAFVQFKPYPPRCLENLSNHEAYQIGLGNGSDISIDKHFYGLTQLYPVVGAIKADVVAVCGLNGHAYGSWAGKVDLQGQRKMWLRHFFFDDLPQCRTMIYGYNSNLTDNSIHEIPDYTDSFLEELVKARRLEEEKNRPIVFIGHSFGGIIIAQSFVKAKDNEARYGPLFPSTRAIAFFGTPHRGLVIDDILAMAGKDSPRSDLITSLQRGELDMKYDREKFINYSSIAKLKIVSFKETRKTRKLIQGPDGHWSRKGDFFTAVESESSILQLPDSIEKSLAVEGDHSTMVKFGYKGHTTYTSVARLLQEFTLDTGVEACSIKPTAAVIGGRARDLLRILQDPMVNVNEAVRYNEQKTTLLHIASHNGDDTTVLVLLKHGASTGALDEDWFTALHEAAYGGHEKVVEMLLKYGADITAKNQERMNALHLAAERGHEKVVEVLLKNGADITAEADDKNALHLAAECGHEKVVETLLKNGADIMAETKDRNALHIAAKCGHEEVVEVLLENGAEIAAENKYSWNALHLAAGYGHEEVVKVLLENGADVTVENKDDMNAREIAARYKHKKVVALLSKAERHNRSR